MLLTWITGLPLLVDETGRSSHVVGFPRHGFTVASSHRALQGSASDSFGGVGFSLQRSGRRDATSLTVPECFITLGTFVVSNQWFSYTIEPILDGGWQ